MKCVYINLESRPDRRHHCERELEKLSAHAAAAAAASASSPLTLDIVRFPAISVPDTRVACSMSHLAVLRIAKANQWPQVMVVEDDICFTQPAWFSSALTAVLNSDRVGFDVLLLGANLATQVVGNMYSQPHYTHDELLEIFRDVVDLTPLPSIHKVHRAWTTTGYIVQAHYYDAMIDNICDGIKNLLNKPHMGKVFCIDVYWHHLMATGEFLAILPRTVSQIHSFSDIERTVISYDSLMLDTFPNSA
jgi:glycosyl transferase family 25